MGWTGKIIFGKIDRKAECDKSWTQEEHDGYPKLEVLKSRMIGSTYYAAIKSTKNNESKVFAVVTLTSVKNHELMTKEMDETCGPYETKCPNSILNLLPPTDNEWANEWREKCRKYNERKRQKKTKNTVPIGTQIRFTRWDGEVIELVKKAPAYQFRRAWWQIVGKQSYYPSRHIPEDFEIVST